MFRATLLARNHLTLGQLVEPTTSTVTAVGLASLQALTHKLPNVIEALSLAIRVSIAAELRQLSALEDRVHVLRSRLLPIGIVDAQQARSLLRRAYSQQNDAMRTPPRYRTPVGPGAKPVVTVIGKALGHDGWRYILTDRKYRPAGKLRIFGGGSRAVEESAANFPALAATASAIAYKKRNAACLCITENCIGDCKCFLCRASPYGDRIRRLRAANAAELAKSGC